MIEKYDIVIVGGGMVGATLACCLGDSTLRVAVIERSAPKPYFFDQPHDLRVSALSIASKNILQMIGVWQGIVSRRYCPYARMRVWEAAGNTEFNSHEIQRDVLGYIVENRIIQLSALERLQKFENVDLCYSTIEQLEYIPGASEIKLNNGDSITGDLIVAADGGESAVRKALGLGVTSWDYQQHAMVVYIETFYGQQDITWQRFTPSGPQAFLPLPGNYGSLVWYNSPDEVRRLKKLSPADLAQEITRVFPSCLGKIKRVINVASFPLKRQHAQQYVKAGAALIGDAAHMINPLAGQGVNIGLLDAAALAQVLLEAHAKRKDFASLVVLKEYEAMRRNENLKMMTIMDVFYRLFSNRVTPLKLLRNVGFELAERITPAKKKIMRYAMGLEGKLPKLAKGEQIN